MHRPPGSLPGSKERTTTCLARWQAAARDHPEKLARKAALNHCAPARRAATVRDMEASLTALAGQPSRWHGYRVIPQEGTRQGLPG